MSMAKKPPISKLSLPSTEYLVTDTVLGKGSFGIVRLGKNLTTGEEVAIKEINIKKFSQTNDLKYLKSELTLHMELKHPHIVTFYDHCVCRKLNL